VLLLGTDWPGALAGQLVLAYIANIVEYVALPDTSCETANRGWRRSSR
jgi:hypothetical protein